MNCILTRIIKQNQDSVLTHTVKNVSLYCMNKPLGILLGLCLVSLVTFPSFAQSTTPSVSSKAVVACNQDYKKAVQTTQNQFKNNTITKEERNVQLKTLQKKHTDCVKTAVDEKKTLKKGQIMEKKIEVKQKIKDKKQEIKETIKDKKQELKTLKQQLKSTPTPTI